MKKSEFRLNPKKMEFSIWSNSRGNCESTEDMTLFYKVSMTPKINYQSIGTGSNSMILRIDFPQRGKSVCNYTNGEISLSVNEVVFKELLTFFHENRLPSHIDFHIGKSIDTEDPDIDELEKMEIVSFSFNYGDSSIRDE